MSGDFQILLIGFIPKDWISNIYSENRISVGDPDTSNTEEVFFSSEGGKWNIDSFLTNNLRNWFNPKSELWRFLAKKASLELSGGAAKLDPIKLGKCWPFFNEEALIFKGSAFVAGPKDGGEFLNIDSQYNGCYYVSYCFCSDGEYFDERIVVLK